jgi:serine carboxypeptidase-like clade 1
MSPEEAKKHSRRRIPNQLAGPAECIDGIAAGTYLNTKVVQQAINVASAAQYYGEWTICSSKVNYTPTASNLPALVYPALISKYKVLIYNGDVDACVPVSMFCL